jgi:hypothetical protein
MSADLWRSDHRNGDTRLTAAPSNEHRHPGHELPTEAPVQGGPVARKG